LSLLLALALLGSACGPSTQFATQYYQKAKQDAPYDVIIVPGVPYQGESSRMNLVMAARMQWSKYLYDQGIARHIIYSGAAVSNRYIEGQAMKVIADSLGIPTGLTFAETRAEHSAENVWYSMLMARRLGFKRIALATDPYQTKSLRGFLRKRCNNMPYIPIIFHVIDSDGDRRIPLPAIDPSSAIAKDFRPLSEREGFWERLRGTMGKHIYYDQKD
jgi:uncharacterized SAM-binding protein YcdF (DUF218 family)